MIRRYSPKMCKDMVFISPGEYYATARDEAISTLLGSCVAVCLHDDQALVGGMNHFMLPHAGPGAQYAGMSGGRYGHQAMKLLLGTIASLGGRVERLKAKVFGAGNLLERDDGIGQEICTSNLEFIRAYLRGQNMPLVSWDVGGKKGREVVFLPASGRALVKALAPPALERLAHQERRCYGQMDCYGQGLSQEQA